MNPTPQAPSNAGTGSRTKLVIFGIPFALIYLAALAPPIYIGVTRAHQAVLGLPVSVWYMFAICILAVALCAALYAYEVSRKEVD